MEIKDYIYKFSRQWRLRGGTQLLKKVLTLSWKKLNIYRNIKIDVFRYPKPAYRFRLPNGYDLELREIKRGEMVDIPEEIKVAPEMERERYEQGARCYVAIWNGKVADFCWAVSGGDFYDRSEDLWIHLSSRECYLHDYRGIRQDRPMAFSRFSLMKALFLYAIEREEARRGGPLIFYSIVDDDNRSSQAFHHRYLNMENPGSLRLRIIFGRRDWIIPDNITSFFSK